MNKKKYSVDFFKNRTLSQLSKKNEGFYNYPINSDDLIKIDFCCLCGSNEVIILTEVYLNKQLKFNSTSTCNKCLFTYRSVSPSLKWFQKCWNIIANQKLEVFGSDIELTRERRYINYYNLVRPFVKGSLALDIGAAYGTGSKVFQNKGFNMEAVEPEDNKSNYLEKALGIKCVARTIEELINQKHNYNLLIMANCLEHLDNPFDIMKKIKNLMHPEGILYIDVPIIWRFVSWSDAFYLTHKSYFTEENLLTFIENMGFKILNKVDIEHSKDEPLDVGLVLKKDDRIKNDNKFIKYNSVKDVQLQYRKGLPSGISIPSDYILKYNVPYIEHFFQTIKLNQHEILYPSQIKDNDFIEFT